jgi:hypothetical protein
VEIAFVMYEYNIVILLGTDYFSPISDELLALAQVSSLQKLLLCCLKLINYCWKLSVLEAMLRSFPFSFVPTKKRKNSDTATHPYSAQM